MKKNIAAAITLIAIGFLLGFGLKLLMWVVIVVAVALGVCWSLTAGGKMGEDDIEEVFPNTAPDRSPEARHEWRNSSAKAPHAE
ncbi:MULTISPECIES: hypothetical protein [unclassified Cupriavidus]|uniref:hypothetical protein n=1 Tax=unclassified Cupriavidus TaxID=2640874 RepID=UPI001C003D39|nr:MULTISPECIES: hypothetical protein [unclassified Cupriavidus]MCA3183237.1 hypothetical protein [Cupriavidus sp.]MCA3194341.1 hypothetical protein [Cupriavidus sp.]MCA3200449.1 hypothetical protein [Cupriavidus sp.]MCA3231163.1 hypothetical protein [Cupriavidus sp.]QWE95317.1 hypothetical protein KLP38_05290 [Cupriavidus sp. EM10]